MGRERQAPEDTREIHGRTEGDAEQMFPRYTHATAATTGQVTVNGKTLHLWTYQQLEALNAAVLKQRANAIRDAVGDAFCPPIPSGRPQELTQWILHMQEDLTSVAPKVGRINNIPRKSCVVPQSFAQDSKARPVGGYIEREVHNPNSSQPDQQMPFGRRPGGPCRGARDNFHDLKYNLPEAPPSPGSPRSLTKHGPSRFDDPMLQKNECAGRKHYQHGGRDNMQGMGVSEAEFAQNVTASGRKVIGCHDNLMAQQKHLEAVQDGRYVYPAAPDVPSPRSGLEPVRHVSETHMGTVGRSEACMEPHIGGERKRHIGVQDSMLNHGTSDAGAILGTHAASGSSQGSGRKYLDGFKGQNNTFSGKHTDHQSTWKKDPSRLHGNSLLV